MAAQNLISPHSGMKQTLTPGDPMSRAMSQYGKGHTFAPTGVMGAMNAPAGPVDMTMGAPGKNPGPPIKDGKGGIGKHIKAGGIGAGPNGSYGSPRNYGSGQGADQS